MRNLTDFHLLISLFLFHEEKSGRTKLKFAIAFACYDSLPTLFAVAQCPMLGHNFFSIK